MSTECELDESHCYDYCDECNTCHTCLNEWQIKDANTIESLEADNALLKDKVKELTGSLASATDNHFDVVNKVRSLKRVLFEAGKQIYDQPLLEKKIEDILD